MKKSLLVFTYLLCTVISFSQTIDITGNPSSSGTSAFATNLYAANESIYTETEIGAGNFTTSATAINKIGFNVATLGAATSFGSIKIYMMEVPNGTTTMASGTYSTAGYTQVFGGASGANVILSTTGFTEIPLSTAFVRTAGNNLQVLIERADNTTHNGFLYRTANGNNSGSTVLSGRRYNNTTPLSATTTLTASAFRAQIRLKHESLNDAALLPIYSLGKLPINNAVPHVISTTVVNNGVNTLTALPVTLNLSGANTFTNVQTIASIAPGARAVVNFAAFTPTVLGTNNISVSIPNDDDNSNNSATFEQVVNANTWSYSQGSSSTGTAGLFGNTIDFATKYQNTAATQLTQATVSFLAGGQPFKLAVWDASGAGGEPGNLLYESATLNTVAGINMVPIAPALSIPAGNFYVGVRQTTTTNFNLLRQTESPLRGNTFYFSTPAGAAWVDNSTTGTNRFMIDVELGATIDAAITNLILPNNGATTCNTNNETISAEITNVGSTIIAANAASITLKIAGANPQILQTTNSAPIPSGASATVNFLGINLTNSGVNFDTVYVNLPGDVASLNDTMYRAQTVRPNNVGLQTTTNTYVLTPGCEEMGWTYYNDVDQKSVLAVEWGNNVAAKAAAVASLTLDVGVYSAKSGSGASAKGTFTMQRFWNIDVGSTQPTTPVKIRFFYSAQEKNDTEVAANTFQQNNPGSVVKGFSWFKTNTGSFANDAAHVTSDGVLNAAPLTNVNSAGNTINGVLYAQFNNVTSFSGGTYASGIGTGSVLPVNITYFKGSKQGEENILNWKINCSGSVTLRIILERSTDGKNFNTLSDETVSEARCLQPFTFVDALPQAGVNYYRIVTITPDGKKLYSIIVALINKANGFELITIAPNPVKSNATLNFTTAKKGNYIVTLNEITGKIINRKLVSAAAGNNFTTFECGTLRAGIYTLKVTDENGESKTMRLIKY